MDEELEQEQAEADALEATLDEVEPEAPEVDDEAESIEGVVESPEAHADPAAEASLEACRTLCELASGLVAQIWPVLATAYPDDLIDDGARHLQPLTGRDWFREWAGGVDFLDRWGPEISAGMWFAGVAIGSVKAVRESKAEPQVPPGSDGQQPQG